jgi:hypothetical protein
MKDLNRIVISGAIASALIVAGCSKSSQTSSQNPPPATQAPASSAPAPATPGQEAAAPAPVAQQAPPAPEAPPPPPPQPASFTIPAGTAVSVRTTNSLSTKTVKSGDPFEATLTKALVSKGVVIAPKGAAVRGVVTESDSGGRVKGRASLAVDITSVETTDGQRLRIQTNALQAEAKGTKKKDAAKIGIGAGIGAAIGAIAGGGKGAGIGAAAGAGGGTALVLGTKGAPAVIPAESVLNFTLRAPLKVTEKRPGSLKKPE